MLAASLHGGLSQEQRDPKATASRIWTIPVAGGEPTPLTPEGVAGSNPVWSPDGTHLAFGGNIPGDDLGYLLLALDTAEAPART